MLYRREIDGLRAIAVIPVILFHAGFSIFSGGFVGVDVFFVISGYLITTIILSEMERGTFSLINFYERRTRRILPALFLVMLVTLPFAYLWLLPADLMSFSQSLIAVSTFSSNILFWQTSGYWGTANELIPLLHTWSLAVEEQYYFIFPLFLMMMWRFRKRWILTSFVLIAAVSLLLAQWGAYNHPTANFFLLITRGWELAIGAGIAFYFVFRKQATRRLLSHKSVDEVLSLLGLLMIAYAVFLFDETTPFPSFYTIIPTVGTGLIIIFSAKTMVGQLLGLKLFVGLGLISYSAYLWHQPLFAFAKYRSVAGPGVELMSTLAVLSILLAYLSWRFFEKPFRQKGLLNRKTIFTFAGVGSLFFIVVGLAGNLSGGLPDRIDGKIQASIEAAKLPVPIKDLCTSDNSREQANEDSCTLLNSDNFFGYLMGDSHADALAAEIKNAFEQANIGLIQATERGCPPVQDVYVYVSQSDKRRCFQHNQDVYRHLENSPDIEYIILVARWALYLERKRFSNDEGGSEPHQTLHFNTVVQGRGPDYNRLASFKQAYVDSVKKIIGMGKKVILVYPIPEAGWNVPRYVRNYYLSDPSDAFSQSIGSTSYSVFQDRNKNAYQALDGIGEHPNIFRVFPEKIFCNNDVKDRCIVQKDETLLYSDDDHLSSAGAILVVKEIMGHLQAVKI
jgi:peptidoglycan/LPS O-acetylase OafA/YrhL